jgi:arginase
MKRKYEIIGATFDLGACEAGSNEAPQVLREKILAKRLDWLKRKWGIDVVDGGDVPAPNNVNHELTAEERMKLLAGYSSVLYERVGWVYDLGRTPVVLGGDHAVSISTVSAAASDLQKKHGSAARLGLLWIDAHADLNTKENGNPHGRAAAVLLGHGPASLVQLGGFGPKVRPEDLILIGVRDLAPNEHDLIKQHSITIHGIHDVDMTGFLEVCRKSLARLEDQTDGFVLSFDVDACDGAIFPGCSTPLVGGLSAREARMVFELTVDSPKLMGIDLVEFNPRRDVNGNTLNLMGTLIDAALGWKVE